MTHKISLENVFISPLIKNIVNTCINLTTNQHIPLTIILP